jgi:hemoglobin-like flavoprotein
MLPLDEQEQIDNIMRVIDSSNTIANVKVEKYKRIHKLLIRTMKKICRFPSNVLYLIIGTVFLVVVEIMKYTEKFNKWTNDI